MSEVPSAEKDAGRPVVERRDAKCRCFRFPHDRGDRSAPCRHSLTADEEAVFAVVRRFTADTKEKRDWPRIADEQAVKIVLGLSSADCVLPPAMTRAESDPHATNGRVSTAQNADGDSA